MESKIEKLEKNKVKITMNVDGAKFEEGMNHSYNKNKGKMSVSGFRQGKAPRAILEKTYGKHVFMDDAINYVFPEAFDKAVEDNDLDPVSRPELSDVSFLENGDVAFEVLIDVKPEVTLGEYKGLAYREDPVDVTDEEVDAEIEKAREKNARLISVSDRPIQNGDVATIDFEGFVENVPFEGGKGADYALTIGSKTFIDTFEEQLIGKSIGDDVEVNVTFPEVYQNAELAGRPALFKVEIKDVQMKQLPELDDDFAQDVSEFNTFDEYKKDLKETLILRKASNNEKRKEEDLITKAALNAEIDIPDSMIDFQVNQMVNEFGHNLSQQGMDLEMFMQYTGQDPEAFRETYKLPATKAVRARLVLEAIAKAENLAPSDEEVDEELSTIANVYQMDMDTVKSMLRPEDIKGIKTDIQTKKALKLIMDSAEVEK